MDPQAPTYSSTPTPIDPPVAPEMPKEAKDNHWVTILAMALFVLGSLAVVVFLYYQNQQLKGMLASYQGTATSPTPITTTDPTANWKTYSHKQLGFTIKYPEEWIIKEDPKFVEFDTNIPSDKKLMDSDKNVNYIFQMSVDPQTNFDEWTKYPSTTKLESQTVGGQVFERYIAADLYYSLNLILKQNGKNFRFMAYPYEANVFPKSLNNDINQILSTFKFLGGEEVLSCKVDADCGVESCGCTAKNKDFIDQNKNICAVVCGNAKCVNNLCTLNPLQPQP